MLLLTAAAAATAAAGAAAAGFSSANERAIAAPTTTTMEKTKRQRLNFSLFHSAAGALSFFRLRFHADSFTTSKCVFL